MLLQTPQLKKKFENVNNYVPERMDKSDEEVTAATTRPETFELIDVNLIY